MGKTNYETVCVFSLAAHQFLMMAQNVYVLAYAK